MNSNSAAELELGPVRKRKPSTAMNLSLFIPRFGQIYCGALRRGLIHLSILSAVIAVTILILATNTISPMPLLLTVVIISIIPTVYSAWDAHRLALACREDYRLKESNKLSVYAALTVLFISLCVGLAFAVRENFLHPFILKGKSMSPTIAEGSRVFVRKDIYRGKDPNRNDLVAFLNPTNRTQTWVKRVVALSGDTLEIKKGEVLVNGKLFPELSTIARDQADLAPITIPEHHCYVLGDNRANSYDSRFIGPVPLIALVGKVVYIR